MKRGVRGAQAKPAQPRHTQRDSREPQQYGLLSRTYPLALAIPLGNMHFYRQATPRSEIRHCVPYTPRKFKSCRGTPLGIGHGHPSDITFSVMIPLISRGLKTYIFFHRPLGNHHRYPLDIKFSLMIPLVGGRRSTFFPLTPRKPPQSDTPLKFWFWDPPQKVVFDRGVTVIKWNNPIGQGQGANA